MIACLLLISALSFLMSIITGYEKPATYSMTMTAGVWFRIAGEVFGLLYIILSAARISYLAIASMIVLT